MPRVMPSVVALVTVLAFAAPACSREYDYVEGEGPVRSEGDAGGIALVDAGGDAPSAEPELRVSPGAIFTGFDGTHTFQAPFAVYGAGDGLEVAVGDPNVAEIAPLPREGGGARWFLLTAKQAGATEITATWSGVSARVPLTIAGYAPGRYEVGRVRYTNAANGQPACAFCHGGDDGVDHSPAVLVAAPDEDIERVILAGIKIDGNTILTPTHTWAVSLPELEGLVTYLRALPPR